MADAAYRSEGFISRDLAQWACSLRFEDLSGEAIERARLFWFDSLGCALGGSQQEDAKILLAHHRQMAGLGEGERGTGPCRCFVSGLRTNPVDAAFLNSHMIRAMDYNDIYWKADPVHPSDILGAPLAICEFRGSSGRDLILATIIAYEIEMRLAEIGRPGIREYGWHHATLTGFAAPFAAGKALGLDEEQMVNGVGICASRTGSLGAVTAGKLTCMKNTVDPWAARMGVESAILAARGYTGPEHIFDGKEGLFHAFGHNVCNGEACRFDAEGLTRDLPRSPGDRYRILDCGMKSFPIEALSHSPLTAMLRCVADNGIRAEDVVQIRVEVIARAADILGDLSKYRPRSRETADHSLPYCMAVGLADGMVTPLQFRQERIEDRSLEPIMDMVRVEANDEFEALFPEFQPSRVTITLRDGTTHATRVDVPKGDPRDPMSAREIGVKASALGVDVIGQDACDRLGESVSRLDEHERLDGLLDLMTA